MPFIHFNLPLSLKAGAEYPGRVIRDIAGAASLPLYWGPHGHYGNDYMGVPTSDVDYELVKEMLDKAKIHWNIVEQLPYDMRFMAN